MTSHSRRYTVVYQADAMSALERLAEDMAIAPDVETIDQDLSHSPQTAGALKSSGYYIARRGAVEIKYHVSDEDRLVRIIGVRRCVHPFDVVLSSTIQAWLKAVNRTLECDLIFDALRHWTPRLRRDPRLVGHRNEDGTYSDQWGRVVLRFEISDLDCRVKIISLDVR